MSALLVLSLLTSVPTPSATLLDEREKIVAQRPGLAAPIGFLVPGAFAFATGTTAALAFAFGGTGDVGFMAVVLVGGSALIAATGLGMSLFAVVKLVRALAARERADLELDLLDRRIQAEARGIPAPDTTVPVLTF